MKFKNKVLFITFFLFFCFLSTKVNATDDSLIIDGYDMSDVYNRFSKDASFFIFYFQGDYWYYAPFGNYYSYVAIQPSENSTDIVTYYDSSWNECGWFSFHKYNKTTHIFDWQWDGNLSQLKLQSMTSIKYTSKGIYNTDHKTFYLSPTSFMPTLEWSFDRRVDTIIMSSQHFSLDTIKKYKLYYTTDSSKVNDYKNLDTVPIGSLKDTSGNTSYFWFLSFDNYYVNDVTYYFILEDIETEEILASTMKVDFGSLNSYFDNELNQSLKDQGFYGESFTHGVPTLNMKYTRFMNGENSYYYEISSQYFSKYEVVDQYIAYYTNDSTKDFSTWDTLNIATLNNTKTGQTNYYYFFNTPSDSENATYYFVLYNKVTGQYGSISSLKLDYEKMWEYSEQLKNDNNVVNSRFDKLIAYLKDRFGLLFYPFELIADIFNRFYSIKWEEPILKIPALSVPLFGYHLTNEITYNFNDLLVNPTVKYIHDVYLIIADVILIFCVIKLAIKVFEEVLVNG